MSRVLGAMRRCTLSGTPTNRDNEIGHYRESPINLFKTVVDGHTRHPSCAIVANGAH